MGSDGIKMGSNHLQSLIYPYSADDLRPLMGKTITMFSLSSANLFPLSSALEAVRLLDLPAVLTKAFRPLTILVSETS